ncbi:methyltransferase [Zestomonas thermotolerans]|uniref:methyltransferase n=1 Tax=Zestomonas thermotolerans TaxID=157784 RepID=UPI0023F11763|nr:methyltransferase [Pseudomonas thermotolerans]
MMLSGPALRERFQALDDFLLAHQALWRPRPFRHRRLPWEERHPELAAWLRRRTLAEAETAHGQPEQLDAPEPFPQLAARAHELASLGELPSRDILLPEARFASDVPGRKWQQIQAFSRHLRFATEPRHWLDWCSGKGHLGHLLAWQTGETTCLEHDPALVEAGRQLAQRRKVAARHLQQDVLAADAILQVRAEHTPVALHACGDLHVRLLQLASRAGCRQLAVAPCCYNRTSTPRYQPLSIAARASQLTLDRDDLSLPLSETVTAGTRVRQQRDTSMARRLAFDLLQRELRSEDAYLPTPSLPSTWLHKDFHTYCRDLAALKDLPTPPERDWAALEAQGWQRLAEVRNLELLRALFRRPLELWLLLDRALYLEERGYQVRLGRFCAHQLSPRNLLLLAERP